MAIAIAALDLLSGRVADGTLLLKRSSRFLGWSWTGCSDEGLVEARQAPDPHPLSRARKFLCAAR